MSLPDERRKVHRLLDALRDGHVLETSQSSQRDQGCIFCSESLVLGKKFQVFFRVFRFEWFQKTIGRREIMAFLTDPGLVRNVLQGDMLTLCDAHDL